MKNCKQSRNPIGAFAQTSSMSISNASILFRRITKSVAEIFPTSTSRHKRCYSINISHVLLGSLMIVPVSEFVAHFLTITAEHHEYHRDHRASDVAMPLMNGWKRDPVEDFESLYSTPLEQFLQHFFVDNIVRNKGSKALEED